MLLPISTDRLLLRRYTYADIADIVEYASHPSVDRVTPDFEATEAGVKKYIDTQNSYQPFELNKCFDLAIEFKEKTKVIGLLSFVHKEHHKADIGYALSVDYRGQGITTEAVGAIVEFGFSELGLHRIQADTDSTNVRAWQLMERIGMTREACLRETVYCDGEWLDTVVYGILVDEWR